MLLSDRHRHFANAVGQSILVDFFKMAMAEVLMKSKTGFTNLVTKQKNTVFHIIFFATFVPFCGEKSEPVFFQPSVKSAAAQAQLLCSFPCVAVAARHGAFDEVAFNFFEAHVVETF